MDTPWDPPGATWYTILGTWSNVDLAKIKIWILHIPVAKACSWLMLDAAVTICAWKRWRHLKTLLGHLHWDRLGAPWDNFGAYWDTLTNLISDIIHSFCVGCIWSKPLYISDKVIAQVYDTTKIIGKSSIMWSIDTDIEHPEKVIFM